ncbi:alpha/beta fold hydrolase [Nocardia sp. NPDC050697]|uniref:thioesterase II family protein n=1 Tax=Nocardia sp. NPDC050697 TaxID=3155158 RepID=UPI0033F4B1AF
MPHAGGSASFYFPISQSLAPQCEVLAIQYPGRQDRRAEKNIESAVELADSVFQRICEWTDRPTYLFGHSLGAIVAYEVARKLEAENIPVKALFVSGRRAPSRHRTETVHTYNDEELIREVKRLSSIDSQILANDEVLQMTLPAIRSDYKAAETYRELVPMQPLKVDIYAHIGVNDPKVARDEAEDWAKHTSGSFTLSTYPGGHFYLISQSMSLIEVIRTVIMRHSLSG